MSLSPPLRFRMKVLPTMAELGAEAGAGTEVMDYFLDRGIVATGTLALLADNTADLKKHLVEPLLSGHTCQDGRVLQVADRDKPIVTAIMTHMWELSMAAWRRAQASTPPTAPTPSGTGAGSSKDKADAPDKVPKTLPPGMWSTLVTKYNSGHAQQPFPELQLLGAESVVARVHHEVNVSRQYTPVTLSEILLKRSFNGAGEINPLRSSQKASKLMWDDDQITVEEESSAWEPRSQLAILDALTAIHWLYILVGFDETHVREWMERLGQRLRQRPQKTAQFRAYYEAVAWRICAMLRQGLTWKESSDSVLADANLYAEAMAKEASEQSSGGKKRKWKDSDQGHWSETGGEAKGKSKGKSKTKTKTKQHTQQDYNKQSWDTNKKWEETSQNLSLIHI